MGSTPAPEKAGAVSMWASSPRAGAPSHPGAAGRIPVTTPNRLTRTSSNPSSPISHSSSRTRSHCRWVLGLVPVPSADSVLILT